MIEFEDVNKTYGRPGRVPAALNGISFHVEEGDFALLMGPSGSGKSTLIKNIFYPALVKALGGYGPKTGQFDAAESPVDCSAWGT